MLLLGGGFALAKGSEVSATRNVNLAGLMYTRFCDNAVSTPINWTRYPVTLEPPIFLYDILIVGIRTLEVDGGSNGSSTKHPSVGDRYHLMPAHRHLHGVH